MYGINQEDFINTRDEFKSLKKALDTILELGDFKNVNEIFNEQNNPKDSLGRLLIAALKSDIDCMINIKR